MLFDQLHHHFGENCPHGHLLLIGGGIYNFLDHFLEAAGLLLWFGDILKNRQLTEKQQRFIRKKNLEK